MIDFVSSKDTISLSCNSYTMFSLRHISIALISYSLVSSVSTATPVEPQFSYRSFASCSELESTMREILPTTYDDGRMYK